MNVIFEICSQNLPRLSVKLGVPQCSQNFFNTACKETSVAAQPARKHPWPHSLRGNIRGQSGVGIHCLLEQALFSPLSRKEVQKITRLSGTVYIRGRAEWGQHGGSAVVSSQ